MRKQLTLKKLTLFVLSTLLCLLLAIAGITLGSSTQAFADEPTTAPDTPAENPSGHDATHDLQELHVIYPATCVEPGIAVAYCNTCGRNVSVVLPADGVSHSVPLMLASEDNSAEGVCELCGAKTGGFNRKVVTEGDDQYVEVSAIKNSALTSITIPATVDVEGVGKDLPVHVKEGAFEGNDTIEKVTIEGAVEVGENAFKDCSELNTLEIKDGTQIIGASAFENCPITEVNLPASVVSIGEDAFKGTAFYYDTRKWTAGEGLKSLVANDCLLEVATAVPTKPAAPARGRRNAPSDPTASYTVADSIKVIADGALKALKSLTEVNLPAGLKTVGKDAFPETIVTITITAGIEEGSYSIFEGLKFKPEIKVNIYYGGGYAAYLEPLSKLPGFRFLSEIEPNDNAHNYWYHDTKTGAITHWAHLKTIEVDTTNATTDFLKESVFSSKGIVVTVTYDDEKNTTRTLTDAEYTVDDSAFDSTKVTGEGEYYEIKVSYLYVETSYHVTVGEACIVKLVFNNGEEPTEKHVPVIKGKTYKLPTAPNRPTGYDFAGWLIDGDETLHEPGYEFQVTADITVNAQWTAREPDVKMNYDKGVQGTAQFTAEFDKATETYTVKVSGTPTRTGYTFTGWDYDANGTKGTLPVEGGFFDVALDDTMTVTVTAKWTVVGLTPTVSYDNGEQGTAEVTAKFDETKESYTVTVKGTPTRTGYKFLGWTVTGGTPTELGVEGGDITVALADEMTVTVTARWEQLYTVSVGDQANAAVTVTTEPYATDGANKYYENGATVTFTVTVDNGYKLAENGVTVTGATLQGGTYTFTVGTENVTINVTTEQVKVILVWQDEDGTPLEGYADIQAQLNGATATVTASKTPTKTGYTFKEWSVSYGETSTTLAKDGTLTLDLGNKDFTVTLTATWTRLTPTVEKVDLAGGTGDVTTSYTFDEETNSYTVTINGTPTYEKHRFDGWTVSGDVEATLTAEQNTFTVTLSDDMNVTVTAKWVARYTVSYDLGGHSKDTVPASETVDENKTVTLPDEPTADGNWKFTGWKVGDDATLREVGYELTVTADVTVTAQWTKIYTVPVQYVGLDEADRANVTNFVTVKLDSNGASYIKDTQVTLTVEIVATTKYALNKVEATNCVLNGENGNYSFTVGESDIVITVTLDRLYHVTVETDTEADIIYELNPVDVDVAKNEGGYYKSGLNLKVDEILSDYTVTVSSEDVVLSGSVEKGYTFTMVSKDVTIEIRFVKHSLSIIGGEDNVTTTYEREVDGDEKGPYLEGETVMVTINATGPEYKVTVEISGVEKGENGWQDMGDGEYWITMTADVTITVTLERLYHVSVVLPYGNTGIIDNNDLQSVEGYYPSGTSFTLNDLEAVEGYTLTVTAEGADLTGSVEEGYKFQVGTNDVTIYIAATKDGFNPLEAPVAGTEFYLGMKIADGKYHYIDGSFNSTGYYLTTTTDIKSAKKVSLEASGDGWLIIVDGKYLEIDVSGTHGNPVFKTSQNSEVVWTWNSEYGIFTWGTDKWFLGTRMDQDYDTIGGCAWTYVTSDYVAVLGFYQEHVMTDKEKVDAVDEAIAKHDIPTQLTEDYPLPTLEDLGLDASLTAGVSITWVVTVTTDGADSESAKVEGGILKIKRGADDIVCKLTAKISCGSVNQDKDITVTILKEGAEPEVKSGSFKVTVDSFKELTSSYGKVSCTASDEYSNEIGITIFAHKSSGMEFNQKQGASYVVNSDATPAPISEIIVKCKTAASKDFYWYLYTGQSAFTIPSSGNPTVSSGTSRGRKQVLKTETELTWTIKDGSDKFFVLYLDGTSASQVSEITIKYGSASSSGGSDTDADQQKVDAAAAAFTLTDEQKTYSEAKTYDLPTTASDGVTISWALKGTSTYCSINSNKLTISSLPSEDTEVQLTATFSLNGKTATNDYTITIKKQIGGGGGDTEVKTWQKLTDAADLVEGAQIVLVSGTYFNKGSITTGSKGRLEVVSDSKWSAGSQNLPTDAQAITLEKHKGASGYEDYWLFKLGDKYLYLTGTSSNSTMALETSVPSKDNNGYFWGIALDTSNNVTITNKLGTSNCVLRFNSSGTSYWFANYSSTASQAKPDIYILKAASSDEAADDMEVVNAVYTMAGNVTPSDAGTSPILWISIVSVGAVLISLGAVVVILVLRKKSE